MNISWNIKNILNLFNRLLLIAVLCFVATKVAEAKTINSSNQFIDETRLNYFENIFNNGNYKYLYVASEYGNYSDYYVCFSNTKPTIQDESNLNTGCDKMYRYYRDNYNYIYTSYSDNSMIIYNGIYYTYSIRNNSSYSIIILCIIGIGVLTELLYIVLRDLWGYK